MSGTSQPYSFDEPVPALPEIDEGGTCVEEYCHKTGTGYATPDIWVHRYMLWERMTPLAAAAAVQRDIADGTLTCWPHRPGSIASETCD